MHELGTVERREVIEERGNRDAFRICMAMLFLVFVALVVLGIFAWNTRFITLPMRADAPARQKTLSSWGQDHIHDGIADRPAELGLCRALEVQG